MPLLTQLLCNTAYCSNDALCDGLLKRKRSALYLHFSALLTRLLEIELLCLASDLASETNIVGHQCSLWVWERHLDKAKK